MASVRAFLRRHVLWSLGGLAAVLGAGSLLAWRASSRKPRYVTAVVTRGGIQRSVSTTGALNPVVTVQVGSYVSGTIKSLSCDNNTEVVVAEDTYSNVLQGYVRALGQRLSDSARLFIAVGGGWWSETSGTPPPAQESVPGS